MSIILHIFILGSNIYQFHWGCCCSHIRSGTLSHPQHVFHTRYIHTDSFGLVSGANRAEGNALVTLKLRLVQLRAVGS